MQFNVANNSYRIRTHGGSVTGASQPRSHQRTALKRSAPGLHRPGGALVQSGKIEEKQKNIGYSLKQEEKKI